MPRFTEGELEVMRILWEKGPMKPAEIEAEFPRDIKNPALRSYLTILLEKGHVVRRREGKAFVYQAKTRKDSAFSAMYRELVDTFCAGSAGALVARLIKAEKLTAEELSELRKLATESEGDKS